MLRKLAIAIAASGAMMSATNVLALGMGDIELESALNQPLDARIKLLKASELENWEMKPNLASSEEFEKSGVEHVFFLNSLKFEIERSAGEVYIHVTSQQTVVEPFLNFLVQVDWPNGRLLREYTLLLDPPVFTDDMAEPVQPAESENYTDEDDIAPESMALPGTAPAMADDDTEMSMPVEKLAPEKAITKKAPKKDAVYKVRADDTLWEVAIQTRANRKISPQQAMLAIQDLNPSAFIDGNINRLKKNQVLRVPNEQQMLSRSFDDAVSEVAIQNQAIAKRKAQLDATRKDAAMQRDDKFEGAQLKLLAGGEATTENERSASGQVSEKTAGDQSKIEKDLSITLENLDKTTRENQELRTRLDSLEEQINTLQRLINLKDEQMVALQSGMAKKPVKPEQDMPAEVAKPADTSEDLNFAQGPETKAPEATKPEKKAEKPKVKAPVEVPEEPFDPVAFVLENPPVLGAGLGALLLALLGINFARKRKEKQQNEDIQATEFDGHDPLSDSDFDNDLNDDFSGLDGDSDIDLEGINDTDMSDFDSSDIDAGLTEEIDQDLEGEDVLGEVDVYMAYNRLEPARALLEKAISAQPSRIDFRLKLAELLSGIGDEDALAEQVNFINENGSESDKAQAIQFESGSFSESLNDDNDDFSMEFGLDNELGLDASANADAVSNEFSLDDDSSELDFDLDGLELNDSEESSDELDLSSEFDLDFESTSADDLDLGAPLAESIGTEEDGLGLDFESDLTPISDSDDELGLDFETDLSDDSGLSFSKSGGKTDLEFDLDEFDSNSESDNELSFDRLDETGDSDDSLDELSLDGNDSDLEFELDDIESEDEDSLAFDLSDSDMNDIPELSADDDLEGLSFDAQVDEDDVTLDISDDELTLDGDDATEIELASLDSDDDTLPEFEEGLSFDEEEMDLPELTDEVESGIDAELDSLSEDSIDLPTLEPEDNSEDGLPDLEDDFDLSIASSTEELEPIEDVVAGYKENIPSIDDSLDGDDFPPLGDIDDLDLENLDNDLEFLSGTDESETKLDLARAYIDMEDQDGAREILQEVLDEGSDQQKQEANKLLDSLV